MRFGSVCSGIEAASVAWAPLGWKAAWLSEIEPFPCAVLAHHYPDAPNLGDMTALPERIASGEVEAPDVFCGGTPCQAFSVAGLRQSLDDARGNLSLVFCEIANAIDSVRVVRGQLPAIVFWENVPGVLSTKDNAFGCFLAGLAGEDGELQPPGGKWSNAGCVFGPQRTVAWRVLDAQYFGVAQRRRRVFVVASARKGFDPVQVLFEWDGVRRDTAPSREARQTAPTIPSRSTAGGGLGTDFDCDGGLIAGTLQANGKAAARNACASDSGRMDFETETFLVAPAATAIRTANTSANGHGISDELAHTLDGAQGQCVAFDTTQITSAANRSNPRHGDPCHPLAAGAHAPAIAFAIQAGALRTNPQSGPDGIGVQAEHAYTREARAEVQAVVFHPTQDPISSTDGTTHALGCGSSGGQASVAVAIQDVRGTDKAQNGRCWNDDGTDYTLDTHATQGVAYAFAENTRAEVRLEGGDGQRTGALSTGGGKPGQGVPCVATAMQVRRLTPRECERLQGFPDGYTAIPWRKKPASECPDGPRYKALGNSWAVPNVRWIGERIAAAVTQRCA